MEVGGVSNVGRKYYTIAFPTNFSFEYMSVKNYKTRKRKKMFSYNNKQKHTSHTGGEGVNDININ